MFKTNKTLMDNPYRVADDKHGDHWRYNKETNTIQMREVLTHEWVDCGTADPGRLMIFGPYNWRNEENATDC